MNIFVKISFNQFGTLNDTRSIKYRISQVEIYNKVINIAHKSKAPGAKGNIGFTTESTLALGDDFTHISASGVNGTCLAHLNLIIN